jgi:prepilin-type N-terminal cleavage/methylation domain-containing protein
MTRRGCEGVTLIELMLVVVIVGIVLGLAVPGFVGWRENQRVKSAARGVADAFLIARSEAIRTGDHHIVVLQEVLGATEPVVVADDGNDATANCRVDAGELRHFAPAETGVFWGTTASLSNGTPAPGDPGNAPSNIVNGSSFTDASLSAGSPASWVRFQADGLPRLFTPDAGTCDSVGDAGQGGGAIYLTSGRRDYAVVLSPLGTVRVHVWSGTGWSQ